MKEERLKELIDKYYSGYSSPEEEEELRRYFKGEVTVPGYEVEKEIFSGFAFLSDSVPSTSGELENVILRSIDDYEKRREKRSATLRILIPAGIAATLLLALGIRFFFSGKSEPADTYKDPIIAYAETVKILHQVSEKLNRGTKALGTLGRINSVTSYSIKSLEKPANILNNSILKLKLVDRIHDSESQSRNNNKQ